MSFQPVIPLGGMAGWAFLQRTRIEQQAAFEKGPAIARDVDYFSQNIGAVTSAEELVGDYRLLKVSLGAFGLEEDISNKAFIKAILDGGSLDAGALANKLADKRYLEFTKAFGFGDFSTPRTVLSNFPDEIVTAYKTRQFEVAVGEQHEDLRLSLSLERELGKIVSSQNTDDGRWFSVMGNPPLRKVFETALGLPSSFGALDIDLQLSGFRDAAERAFGDGEVAQFDNADKRAELNRLFLVRSQIANGTAAMTSGAIAVTLLSNLA